MKFSEQLIAYVSTLITLIIIMAMGFIFGAFNSNILSNIGAFGLGTAVGGLIGLLRVPSHTPQSVTATTDGSGTATVSSSPTDIGESEEK